MEGDKGGSRKGVSFGFFKNKNLKKLVTTAINDDEKVQSEETDFLKSVEGKDLKSVKPKEEEKELIIPLIKQNRWKVEETGDATTDLAVRELLQEAARKQENEQQEEDHSLTVPLLLKNKIPDGFEADENFDVSLRPDQATLPDYDSIPIEQYGMAMLRGMGWKKGEGIGKNKQLVKPVDAVARPKGLGLGADRSQGLQKASQTGGDGEKKEDMILKKGAFCLVLSGKHKDFYGVVEGIDEDNARLVIKLAVENQSITISQLAVRLVSKTEYSQYSKYINKTKADKYKENESSHKKDLEHSNSDSTSYRDSRRRHKEKHREREHNSDSASSRDSRSSRHHKERHREREHTEDKHIKSDRHKTEERRNHDDVRDGDGYDDVIDGDGSTDSKRQRNDDDGRLNHSEKHRKRKHKEHTSDKRKARKQEIAKQDSLSWLRPHLRVRIIDPEYKKGKYFKTKVVIEDVVSHDSCICRAEEGRVLEGLSHAMLETVIPKMDRAHVMVVEGKFSGQVAEILERDKSSSTATLQLLSNRDHVINLSYDAICEYTGDVTLEFDY